MFPYLPLEGQLVALRMRALREARAFLDPELQAGTLTIDQARKILADDLAFGDAVVKQELDRYTFKSPAQATSYFYGALRMRELRADVEKALGSSFDPLSFHDFVIDQGLLLPHLLREALMTGFVASHGRTHP